MTRGDISEIVADRKMEWLQDRGFSFKDVLLDDESGEEFVINIMEMDEGENGDYSAKKIYLPDFTKDNWNK